MHLAKVYRGAELDRFGPSTTYTSTGALRLRWWLILVLSVYVGFNLVVVLMIMCGSTMTLEPGWHSLADWIIKGLSSLS